MHSEQGRTKTAVCDIKVEDMPKCRPIARIQAYTILPDRAATGCPLGRGALADYVAGMRSLTVAARIGASRSSTFMSRTRSPTTTDQLRRCSPSLPYTPEKRVRVKPQSEPRP